MWLSKIIALGRGVLTFSTKIMSRSQLLRKAGNCFLQIGKSLRLKIGKHIVVFNRGVKANSATSTSTALIPYVGKLVKAKPKNLKSWNIFDILVAGLGALTIGIEMKNLSNWIRNLVNKDGSIADITEILADSIYFDVDGDGEYDEGIDISYNIQRGTWPTNVPTIDVNQLMMLHRINKLARMDSTTRYSHPDFESLCQLVHVQDRTAIIFHDAIIHYDDRQFLTNEGRDLAMVLGVINGH